MASRFGASLLRKSAISLSLLGMMTRKRWQLKKEADRVRAGGSGVHRVYCYSGISGCCRRSDDRPLKLEVQSAVRVGMTRCQHCHSAISLLHDVS